MHNYTPSVEMAEYYWLHEVSVRIGTYIVKPDACA